MEAGLLPNTRQQSQGLGSARRRQYSITQLGQLASVARNCSSLATPLLIAFCEIGIEIFQVISKSGKISDVGLQQANIRIIGLEWLQVSMIGADRLACRNNPQKGEFLPAGQLQRNLFDSEVREQRL